MYDRSSHLCCGSRNYLTDPDLCVTLFLIVFKFKRSLFLTNFFIFVRKQVIKPIGMVGSRQILKPNTNYESTQNSHTAYDTVCILYSQLMKQIPYCIRLTHALRPFQSPCSRRTCLDLMYISTVFTKRSINSYPLHEVFCETTRRFCS